LLFFIGKFYFIFDTDNYIKKIKKKRWNKWVEH
jgi:hypothetical protein